MARFRGYLRGRGEGSRLGDYMTGMYAEVTGVELGVEVTARADAMLGDVITVYATGGRFGTSRLYLGTVILEDGRVTFTPPVGGGPVRRAPEEGGR